MCMQLLCVYIYIYVYVYILNNYYSHAAILCDERYNGLVNRDNTNVSNAEI